MCTVRPPAIAAENGITPPFDCIRKRCCDVDAGVVEPAVEMIDVVHQHRLEIGVEQRGREPRPFADARQHLARQRDVHAGTFLLRISARVSSSCAGFMNENR